MQPRANTTYNRYRTCCAHPQRATRLPTRSVQSQVQFCDERCPHKKQPTHHTLDMLRLYLVSPDSTLASELDTEFKPHRGQLMDCEQCQDLDEPDERGTMHTARRAADILKSPHTPAPVPTLMIALMRPATAQDIIIRNK